MNGNSFKVALVNGSPKISEESTSSFLLTLAEDQLRSAGLQTSGINVRRSYSRQQTVADFQMMLEADAIIFVFPLYFFCVPGILMRFLQDYHGYWWSHQSEVKAARIYVMVNCGFPEPEINEEAVRVIESFSRQVGAQFRLGIMLGAGGMIIGAQKAPFMKKFMNNLDQAFRLIGEDIVTKNTPPLQNIYLSPNFPRRLYLWMADRGWVSSAHKNGLTKKDLLKKPYARTPTANPG